MAEKHSAGSTPPLPPLVEPKPLKEVKTPPAPMSEDELVKAIAEAKAKKEAELQSEAKTPAETASREKHWVNPEFSAEILPAVAHAKTFEESVQGFMKAKLSPQDADDAFPQNEEATDKLPAATPEKPQTIPAMAVTPKETMAPPPKRQSNKTVEELMKLIDRAEAKTKK